MRYSPIVEISFRILGAEEVTGLIKKYEEVEKANDEAKREKEKEKAKRGGIS